MYIYVLNFSTLILFPVVNLNTLTVLISHYDCTNQQVDFAR